MNSDKDLLLVSIFTFITVLTWIFFEWVKTSYTTTIPVDYQKYTTRINTTFDIRQLNNLEERNQY